MFLLYLRWIRLIVAARLAATHLLKIIFSSSFIANQSFKENCVPPPATTISNSYALIARSRFNNKSRVIQHWIICDLFAMKYWTIRDLGMHNFNKCADFPQSRIFFAWSIRNSGIFESTIVKPCVQYFLSLLVRNFSDTRMKNSLCVSFTTPCSNHGLRYRLKTKEYKLIYINTMIFTLWGATYMK